MTARTRVAVSPDVLRWARQTIGVSLEEAAKRIQQPPGVLMAWESSPGSEGPTLGALTTLASLYDRPLSVFLLDKPPAEPAPPPDLRAAPDRESDSLARRSVVAVRTGRRVQALVRDLRGVSDWRPPRGVEGKSIREAAQLTREALGVSLTEQGSWRDAGVAFAEWRSRLERLGVVVLQADMPLGDVRAISIPGAPPVVIVNEHDFMASKVFSLFHELGHLVLGSGAICSPLRSAPMAQAERDADLFAGSALVPAAALAAHPVVERRSGQLDRIPSDELRRVARDFNVSDQVIWYRLRQVGLLSRDVFSDRWAQWRALRKPARRTGKAPMIPRWKKASWRVGTQLAREILAAEERGDITVGQALSSLQVHLEDLDPLAAAVS